MSKRSKNKRAKSRAPNYAHDGLKSAISSMGDPSRDKSASVYFVRKVLTDEQLITAYEGNWMARNLVDIPAMDSLRKGRQWAGDSHSVIYAEEKRLNVLGKLMQAFKKGRLFGGAAMYIGTDQEASEPLDIEKIQKGGIKYLNVMTRLQLAAGQTETDPDSEFYGLPKDYQITSESQGMVTIHPSRLVIFNGDERADNISSPSPTGWAGVSVVQSTIDAITDAQGVFSNTSSLVHEANIDVLGIPNLMANIGNQGYESELIKRALLFAQSKGINGLGLIDAAETLSRNSVSFSQLPQLISEFSVLVAAAGQIPATRFLAQSPSGLVSTGESDMNNYHDLLQSKQVLEIDPASSKLNKCLIRSALGTSEPIPHTWNPLEQMSESDLSKIGKETAETVKIMVDTLAITGEDARALLVHKLAANGSFPNIEQTLDDALGGLGVDT